LLDLDLWRKTNCTIIGVKDDKNRYSINPTSSYTIQPGERLIVMGSDEQIAAAEKIV
jgi:K+/H+ antiporter YhaU regulatory subunit KhtT